jgi:gliding motility-associated-like protein
MKRKGNKNLSSFCAMKKVLLLILILSFQTNSQELLLHYKFDNNVDDSTGNSFTGNSSGVTFVVDRNGNPDSAVSFDGVNDFIDFPNIEKLKPNLPVSFSFWIKYESDDVQDRVVFNTSFKEDVNSGVYLTTQSSTGKLAVGFGDGSSSFTSVNRRSYLSNNIIQSNAWHQIHIVILSNTNMKVYLDCIETGGSYSGTGSGLNYSANPGSLGRHDQNPSSVASYYFKGVLDDFKYYKGEIVPTLMETSFTNLPTEVCVNSSYSLLTTSSNGIMGSWSPVFDASIKGLSVYTFTPDPGQCASSFNHTVEVVDEVTTSFANLETTLCEEATYSLPLTSSNGIIGSWSPVFDSSLIGTTIYTFKPDDGQCASIFTHSVEIINQNSTSFTSIENSICLGDNYSLPLVSSNGIIGSWSPVFDNSSIGTTIYTFTPVAWQCASNFTHSVEVTDQIITSFTSLENSVCLGTSYSLPLISSEGITGNWLPVFDSSSVGTTIYTFKPDTGLCASTFTHSVEVTSQNSINFIGLKKSICLGDSYSFPMISSGGITGNWSPVFDSSSLGARTYTFTPDDGQCASTFTHSLQVTNQITTSFTGLENSVCLGSSYSLPITSSDGINGDWSPVFDSSTIGTTIYTFRPISSSCATNFIHSVEVTNKTGTRFDNLKSSICIGESYDLPITSSNGITGTWFPVFDSSTIGTTIYTFTPDAGQCAINFTHSIEVTNQTTTIFNDLKSSFCIGEIYNLPVISSNGIRGGWIPVFDSSSVGTKVYTFTPDTGQCASTFTHSIETYLKDTPIFSRLPKIIFKDENYNLPSISDNGISGNWTPFFDSSIVGETTYTFNPINAECENSFTQIITISDELIIPLFFTPNNDNVNDFWRIIGLDSYTEVNLSIYDRYGKLLVKPNTFIGWDGKYNGKNMPSNDYWYSLSCINLNNEIILRKGHFSLLRK